MDVRRLGIVVVGGGLGGLRAVESLRRFGYDGAITLISDEELPPYDRPPLSKQLLDPGRLREPPFLRAPGSYGELCTLILGQRAAALDVSARAVILESGAEVPFSSAILAIGTTPRHLPVLAGISHTVRSFGDAVRLGEAIRRHGAVTIVGAGFMGCEIASAAVAAGASVTLIETSPAPLFNMLGHAVAGHMKALHASMGVDLRCGVGVAGVRETSHGRQVILSDDDEVDAPVIAVSIGVEPAIDWLRDSGLEIGNGLVCDKFGETSAPGIYAIGDAAAWRYDSEHPVRVEHWTTTSAQAVTVARNLMTAREDRQTIEPLHYFWSDQCHTRLQCFGLPGADHDVEFATSGDGSALLAAYGVNGQAKAVLGIGRSREVMRLRSRLAAHASFEELAGAMHELSRPQERRPVSERRGT
jgi:3-phenylpropionate/trans-cinnamate dioxygenase ferredoxin reductase component